MKELKLFGRTCSIELLIIGLVIGFIAGGYMLCGCMRYETEGFSLKANQLHKSNTDVNSLQSNTESIDFYANNKISPHCRSNAGSYGGQVCMTQEQVNLIRARGGNTTCS